MQNVIYPFSSRLRVQDYRYNTVGPRTSASIDSLHIIVDRVSRLKFGVGVHGDSGHEGETPAGPAESGFHREFECDITVSAHSIR